MQTFLNNFREKTIYTSLNTFKFYIYFVTNQQKIYLLVNQNLNSLWQVPEILVPKINKHYIYRILEREFFIFEDEVIKVKMKSGSIEVEINEDTEIIMSESNNYQNYTWDKL
jgi:hypothetical protein